MHALFVIQDVKKTCFSEKNVTTVDRYKLKLLVSKINAYNIIYCF